MLLYELLSVIKDTERPLLITYRDKVESYTYREAAIDGMLTSLYVRSLTIVTVGDIVYYSIKLRDY